MTPDDATVVLNLRTYDGERATHSHPYHQVIMSLRGALEVETERGLGLVDENRAAIVEPGMRHAYRSIGDNCFAILDARETNDPRVTHLLRSSRRNPFVTLDEGTAGLCAFARANAARLRDDETLRSSLAVLLLDGLGAGDDRPGEPSGLVRARAFMGANMGEHLTLDHIARVSGLSVAALHRQCRTWHGTSPARLLQDMRLAEARRLLASGDASIADIALACGFSEQSALSRAFRRAFGVSPRSYRIRAAGVN